MLSGSLCLHISKNASPPSRCKMHENSLVVMSGISSEDLSHGTEFFKITLITFEEVKTMFYFKLSGPQIS